MAFRYLAVLAAVTFASARGGGQAGGDQATDPSVAAFARSDLPTLVLLPDTQYYASTFPKVLGAQTAWIMRNRTRLQIAGVLQLGDLVDTWSSDAQWDVVSTSFRVMDGQVPYVVVPGNHDTRSDREGSIDRYFAPASLPWVTGTMLPGKIDNSYTLLDVGRRRWLVLGLEFGPRDAVLAWADRVLKAHANLPAILVTHAYLYEDGSRYGMPRPGSDDRAPRPQRFAPQAFAYTPDEGINDGEHIWQKLIVPNANVRLVFCGHDNGVARLTSVRPDGSRVHQVLSDYQWLYQGAADYAGGSGFLRRVQFDDEERRVYVTTYSPYLDQYLTDDSNQFVLSLDP